MGFERGTIRRLADSGGEFCFAPWRPWRPRGPSEGGLGGFSFLLPCSLVSALSACSAVKLFRLPLPLPQAPSPKPLASSLKPQESRAPGERQPLAASLYSGAMIMPPPYRPAATAATSFGAEIFLNRAIYASRRGKALKNGILYRFCLILRRVLHPYLLPAVHYSSPALLSLIFALLASQWPVRRRAWRFNSLLSFPCQLPLSSLFVFCLCDLGVPGARPKAGLAVQFSSLFSCQLPTAYCH